MNYKDLNFNDIEVIEIYLHPESEKENGYIIGIFTEYRISKKSLPQGIYSYDIRHSDDDDSIPITIENNRVLVNRYGTLIINYPIDFSSKDFIEIESCGFLDKEYFNSGIKTTFGLE